MAAPVEGLEALDPVTEEAPPAEELPGTENEDAVQDDGVMGEGGEDENENAAPDDVLDEVPGDPVPDADDPVENAGVSDDETVSEDGAEDESDVSGSEEIESSAPAPDPFAPRQYVVDVDGEPSVVTVTPVDPLAPVPASVTSSANNYTPQAFQVNLAENRAFGEHYLMWAQRTSYGSSWYWRYYLAVGRNITRSNDIYRYTDAELYSFWTYNSQTTYDVSVSSGSISGSSYLVYSDLHFDYVGTDPAFKGSVYIFFALMLIMIVLLIGGKRHV